jgi:ubiquinone/menaquinone biosynthesis C-methylase UbiE
MPNQPMPEHFSDWNEDMVARHDPAWFHHHPRAVVRWVESRRVRTVLRLLRAAPGDRVLEVGCGAGDVLALVNARERHGVDLSRRMASRAHERLKGEARIALADGESLPYPPASFDRVICSSVLSHVLHPDRVLNESFRVLKPGGRLVVSVSYEAAIERGIRLARALGLGFLVGSRDVSPEQMVYSSEYHLHHFDLELLRQSAQKLPRESALRRVPVFFYPAHLVALYLK